MFLVYLAGPITGLSYEDSTGWRQHTIDRLSDCGIDSLSPLRGKNFLKVEALLTGTYDENPLSTQRGIYARDRYDCTRSDAIIVNLLQAGDRVSIGTVMEIAWAADNSIPVVLVMEPSNVHNHAMIREACPFIVDTVDDAIDVTISLLLPAHH